MTAPATASRSDVLRGRVRNLDALQKRTAAAPGGRADPALGAKQAALSQRIANAKKEASGELARRDRMDRLRREAFDHRQKGLAQRAKVTKADEQLAAMQRDFRGRYPERPLKREHLSPRDRARYEVVDKERKAAAAALEKEKAEIEKRAAEHDRLKKEADEREKAEGQTEGDVADPCVSCVASEVEKLEEEAKKAEEERLALARELTEKGGSGDDADKELVAKELAKLPKSTLEQMKAQGTKVVACRNSVTDFDRSLRGVKPDDWPAGSSWDSVPGMYDPNTNKVVIATRGHGTPVGAHVPVTGDGHGSANLTVHEAMHSIDTGAGGAARSTGTDFNNARNQDIRRLGPYERTTRGQSETWAESAARYYGGGGGTENLDRYWRNNPVGPPPAAAAPARGRGGGP